MHSRDGSNTDGLRRCCAWAHVWLALACACAVVMRPAGAAGFALEPYVEPYVAGTGIDVGEADFHPFFGGITAGTLLRDGVGVEVHLDTELATDDAAGFELAYERGLGVALRLVSPPQRGLSGYAVIGYSQFSLRQRGNQPLAGVTIEDEFAGARLSLGVVQRLRRIPWLSVSAEYRHYNVDGGLNVDAFALGLRAEIPR